MDLYATVNKSKMKVRDQEEIELLPKDAEFNKLNELYDECINYLKYENVEVNEKIENNQIEGKTIENLNREEKFNTELNTIENLNTQEKTIENLNMRDETKEMHNKRTKSQEKLKREDKINANGGEKTIENHNRQKDNQILEKSKRDSYDVDYESIEEIEEPKMVYAIENEKNLKDSTNSIISEAKSDRLRKLSQQLPKIIITQSNSSLNVRRHDDVVIRYDFNVKNEFDHKRKGKTVHVPHWEKNKLSTSNYVNHTKKPLNRARAGYGDFPKRLVSKRGIENVALISNVPFEKIRMLNDTFHTLINLRWRWIVSGTIVVHFAIWLVFAVFWYITALAHYDFEPDPPKRSCVTGGHDFLTIFLASVEAQTTIGFGDRAIDEECPESIFLFIMQLILGTGLSGVLTCVVYAKLTRPEKLSRDGVGFSKKAVISMRDGRLCLMMRAWDLNYDHIIGSEFTAHFVHTHRTKEGEMVRYFAQTLSLQHRQFLLWPLTLVHVIDRSSPLYTYGPEHVSNSNYEITVSLKGASASMGTFTQSQTSYLPKEVLWGHRFPPVVKYDPHKQKYAIDHKKLDLTEPVDTPFCSAQEYEQTPQDNPEPPSTPTSFSEKISSFQLGRSSSFRKKAKG